VREMNTEFWLESLKKNNCWRNFTKRNKSGCPSGGYELCDMRKGKKGVGNGICKEESWIWNLLTESRDTKYKGLFIKGRMKLWHWQRNLYQYRGRCKKSFTILKTYVDLFRRHAQCFELQ
jgi:hypothetical protein